MASFPQLPSEIQLQVFDPLVTHKRSLTARDRHNLCAPMRVNSFWFYHIADCLWNEVSKLETMFKNLGLENDRRQLYVSKIRILNLHTARIDFDLIANLKFDNLTHLTLRGDHMGILPFLQPNLKAIRLISGFDMTSQELNQINELCPNLHELHILPARPPNRRRGGVVRYNPDPIDCDHFLSFFSRARSLKSLTVGSQLPNTLVSASLNGLPPRVAYQLEELALSNVEPFALPPNTQEILEACTCLRKFEYRRIVRGSSVAMSAMLRGLATATNLEHLRLDHAIREDDIDDCIERHDAPFNKLQSLALKGGVLPISRFLSLSLESLTRLQLVVDDQSHRISSSISRLKALTYLNLVIGINHDTWFNEGVRVSPGPDDWEATPDDMQALTALTRLRSFSLRPMNINLTVSWMTDDYFETWISKFPHLQDVELDIECPLSFSSMVALSKTHPFLRRCKLLWTQEIEDWKNLPSTNFANLQRLKLNLTIDADSSHLRTFFFEKFNMRACYLGVSYLQVNFDNVDPLDPYQRPGGLPVIKTIEVSVANPADDC